MRKLIWAALLWPMITLGYDVDKLNDLVEQSNFIVDDRCSGTLIDLEHKIILTANHCVEHKVTSYTVDEVVDGKIEEVKKRRLLDVPVSQKAYKESRRVGRTEYQTEIVARDKAKDLALLRIRADNLPYSMESKFLPVWNDVCRGEKVVTVGNPNMLDASVSTGVVSSLNRMFRVPWANGEEIPFLQHDAATTGGSSGGAVYNDSLQLIGVHVAGYRGVPLGFAVHPMKIKEFLDNNCYPLYGGGSLDEKCKGFGQIKEDEDKADGGDCETCEAEFVRQWWQDELGEQKKEDE